MNLKQGQRIRFEIGDKECSGSVMCSRDDYVKINISDVDFVLLNKDEHRKLQNQSLRWRSLPKGLIEKGTGYLGMHKEK